MKKIYSTLFLGPLLSRTRTHKNAPLQPVKVTVPTELQAYYQGVDFKEIGKALYDELATLTIVKHTNFLNYKNRHKYPYKADASKKNLENVILIYTGEEQFWQEYEGNKRYSSITLNTGHIYPKSKTVTQTVTDLHHLRVHDKSVNSRRGNHPFTEGEGEAKLIGSARYPGDEWKGDVARMVLYLNLCYNEEPNSDISTGGLEMLLKWNDEDPVSDFERQCSNVIQIAQGSGNPFIDSPQLVRLAYQH